MAEPVLTVEEVQTYLQDDPSSNHLLDGLEFSVPRVELAMTMAMDDFNAMPPRIGKYNIKNFPSKTVLLFGTCYHLLLGQSQHLARNTMQYSDGGLQIPVEERAPLYSQIASQFQSLFQMHAKNLKVSLNMEAGFGSVGSDFSTFPGW